MQAGESRGTLTAEPNVIPMIDILLVLLIIFMLINLRGRQVFELQLPEPAMPSDPSERQIVLEVLPGGTLRINQEDVPAAELQRRLEGTFAGRPRKILFVKGDPRVRYQDVVAAVDLARGAGVHAIGIAPKDMPNAP
jgi:biopolymer transport protein TolR